MTQGIFVRGRRPKSKKEIRETVAVNPSLVSAEATSWFPGEYSGPLSAMPDGSTIVFTGPDPHTDRRFYGTIKRNGDSIKVT
jgi:hypothetical protein